MDVHHHHDDESAPKPPIRHRRQTLPRPIPTESVPMPEFFIEESCNCLALRRSLGHQMTNDGARRLGRWNHSFSDQPVRLFLTRDLLYRMLS